MKPNRLYQLSLVLSLSLVVNLCLAQNIGNYGQIFPVVEEDIRDQILRRLKTMESTGELARRQHEIEERVTAHVVRPKPLNLPTTSTPIKFTVDPTQFVSHDIYAPNVLLVAKKGTELNPFEHVAFTKTLFFFNGDDQKQVAWAKAHYQDYSHVKFILTGGDVSKAAILFGRIYFDIGGQLTNKLNITHVPSVVNQENHVWAIQEIGVNDA